MATCPTASISTLYELHLRGWVNVFSAKPVELDEAEACGLDYGDDVALQEQPAR